MTSSQSFFLLRSFRSLKGRWLNLFRPVSLQRLDNTIQTFQPELEALIEDQQKKYGNTINFGWDKRSKEFLEAAKKALTDYDPELGWRYLKAADRFRLYGLERDELKSEARLILAEASDLDKGLTTWRRKGIAELLADPTGKLKDPLMPRDVVRAKRTLDEHQDNVYHKLAILKSRLRLLTCIALIAIGVWIARPPLSPAVKSVGEAANNPLSTRWFWFAVILSGILGAIFSGFSSSLATDQKKTRIPSELSTSTLTFARFSLAMVSAIVITIFLLSGVLSFPRPSLELFLAVAFVSGFSDRLLLRAIDSLSK